MIARDLVIGRSKNPVLGRKVWVSDHPITRDLPMFECGRDLWGFFSDGNLDRLLRRRVS